MGILDFTSKVITEYRADISEHRAAVRSLSGEQKALAQVELEASAARNKHMDDWTSKIGKVALALGGVMAVTKLAFDGLKDYGHRLDLEATAAGVSIQGLSEAAGGLKTNMELLEHAAIFSKSAFKLTQDQMQTAEKAMHALEERGHSSTEVWEAVSSALTKGTTRSLEGFGIIIDKTGLQLDEHGIKMDTLGGRAQALSRIMAALSKTTKELGADDAADEVSKLTVKLHNMWDEIVQGMGKIVVAMKPVIEGLIVILDKIPKGFSDLYDVVAHGAAGDDTARERIAKRHGIDMDPVAKGRFDTYVTGGGNPIDFMLAEQKRNYEFQKTPGIHDPEKIAQVLSDFLMRTAENTQKKIGWINPFIEIDNADFKTKQATQEEITAAKEAIARKILRSATFELFNGMDARSGSTAAYMKNRALSASTDSGLGQRDIQENEMGQSTAAGSDIENRAFRNILNQADASNREVETRGSRYAASAGRRNDTYLSKIFGPIGEFELYRKGFEALTGAVGSAMSAWIDGSMSAGEAFKRFIGEALKGLAVQMAVEAIKETAYGLGNLAIGDVPAATAHFAAAAEFAGGAVLAGVAAQEFGAGGGGGSSRGGGAGGGSGSQQGMPTGGGGVRPPSGQGQQAVIVVGDPFANDSPRMKQINARKYVELAIGGTSGGVSYK